MSERVRNIVAGIALPEEGDPHLAEVVDIADAVGAVLHLVHAYSADPYVSSIVSLETAYAAELKQFRSDVRSQLEARASKLSPTASIIYHAVAGPAANAILDIAREEKADLVAVGASTLGTLAGLIVGTTAQRVLRAATVPTLVISGARARPWRRIVFATDLSQLSARVHERGLALLSVLAGDAEMDIRSLLVAGDGLPLPSQIHPAALLQDAEDRLTAFLRMLNSSGHDVKRKTRAGSAPREIIAEAEEWGADLLVLGTHGRTGMSRFMIGSVAEAVIRKAPCDLLVIPAAAFGESPRADAGNT
jgi:nucleotide-binding universal stress UspA family protein